MKHDLSYFFLRTFTYPFSLFPYSWIHYFGKSLGTLTYYLCPFFRKRTLSNLALAKDLHLSPQEIRIMAKRSFQNLAINILEYPRLAREKDFSRLIQCENPACAYQLYKKGQGIIFFCGHQSNFEALFLDGNIHMKGVAIGKPFTNMRLYKWIVSIREKTGGRIIPPRQALKEGLKNLKKGLFFGILGDQGMPDSNYSFPFLGRRAWTSTAPALLAYKTNSPIIVATTRRKNNQYYIHYSDPIWPDVFSPIESEVRKLMAASLSLLQESIKNNPSEWLWQHNCYKQQTPKVVYREFRHDAIGIFMPFFKKESFEQLLPSLSLLKTIYPREFLFLFVLKKFSHYSLISCEEIFYYDDIKETLREDYRLKLIFNFTSYKKLSSHYRKLSSFKTLTIPDLKRISHKRSGPNIPANINSYLLHALCRPNTPPWRNNAS